MISLYHCVSARSFRPVLATERAGYFLRAAHSAVSAAMCQYLAARHSPGVVDVGWIEPAYGAYLNWLHLSDATLTFPQTLVLRYTHFEPVVRKQHQAALDQGVPTTPAPDLRPA